MPVLEDDAVNDPQTTLPAYHETQSAFHEAFRPELYRCLDALPLLPSSRVLDVPCGDGFYAARALEQLDRKRRASNGRPPANGRHPPADRLSAKQLASIRTACRRGDISEEKLSELIAQVSERATDIVELDRSEASALLDRLDDVTGYRR